MSYLSDTELAARNFRRLGRGVRISERAAIYNCDQIEIGDYSRIDDFCVLSGRISIGRNVHVAVHCNIAGGYEGVTLHDFAGLAYSVNVFSQSDDYSGQTLTNPTVPARFKSESRSAVDIGRHCIVGAGSTIFPGVKLAEGCSVGAMSLVTKSTEAWSIYLGVPARRTGSRSRELLELEKLYLTETSGGSAP